MATSLVQPVDRRHRILAVLAQRSARRPGLTLVELLVSSAIMAMMAAALATLALAVSTGSRYSRGQGVAVQHARVALERIRRACLEAHASELFPGFVVVAEPVGADSFPDTLVVWRTATPADPNGLPLFREVVIFTPDPAAPNRLLEVTAPSDSTRVPAPDNQGAWRSEIAGLLVRSSTQKTQLTDLIRTAKTGSNTERGAVRFHVLHRPSDDELSRHEDGDLPWSELSWAQSIRGSQMGLRQSWCRMELQLTPGEEARNLDPEGATALTFFGSAAIYYGVMP
jgi:prepilin-type N-terminal cleavage/methylation domain-containing protein